MASKRLSASSLSAEWISEELLADPCPQAPAQESPDFSLLTVGMPSKGKMGKILFYVYFLHDENYEDSCDVVAQ